MSTLYVSQQGCYLSLKQDLVIVKKEDKIITKVQLPLLEQIFIFGKSQITTQVLRACLIRNIPIVYLSRMGYCYGRTIAIERGYRQLSRYQQQLDFTEKLMVARQLVKAKLTNSIVILKRQQRLKEFVNLSRYIEIIDYLINQAKNADRIDKLMGYEGAAASTYFSAFSECITNNDFVFCGRSHHPPGNPVNALLSFGYQILWNHLLALIEIQGLDPYFSCLHQNSERHAALASDLIEQFRAPIVDSLVLYMVNRKFVHPVDDFWFKNGGCYLNDSGRKKFLHHFLQRMEEEISTGENQKQPRWNLLMQQVKFYKQFVYNPGSGYQPYLIR